MISVYFCKLIGQKFLSCKVQLCTPDIEDSMQNKDIQKMLSLRSYDIKMCTDDGLDKKS